MADPAALLGVAQSPAGRGDACLVADLAVRRRVLPLRIGGTLDRRGSCRRCRHTPGRSRSHLAAGTRAGCRS